MNPIKDSSLLGEKRGPVTALKGYTKPKFKLVKHTDWEQNFIRQAGTEDVSLVATALFQKVRESFRYLRKDLNFADDGSRATIKSPDFDVNVTLEQDPDDAEQYLLTTQVTAFRNDDILEDERFLEVFTGCCDQVVIELASPMNLADKIDELEQVEGLAKGLDYDPACSYFVLRMKGIDLEVRATSTQIVCRSVMKKNLKSLVKNTLKAFAQLSKSAVYLGIEKA